MDYNLSYVITTRNRLPYLKFTLENIITGLLPDEEIVVVDGNSDDGTSAYLENLHQQKKIQQYISEPDQNQAHGWNKGFLLAQGTIIKKIIDDDVFCLAAIRQCKNWMLDHPEIKICISNTLQTDLLNNQVITKTGRLKQFLDWKTKNNSCFTFSDVYMLIRKDALAFTGLYDTQFRMLDWEFSLRCTFLGIKTAYYTGYNSLTVSTPNNITSLADQKTLKQEAAIAKIKYGYPGDQHEISLWSKLKIFAGSKLAQLKNDASFTGKKPVPAWPDDAELAKIYHRLSAVLVQENQAEIFEFLC